MEYAPPPGGSKDIFRFVTCINEQRVNMHRARSREGGSRQLESQKRQADAASLVSTGKRFRGRSGTRKEHEDQAGRSWRAKLTVN
jgi:hypothetical protein